jgi:hypothetical protein
MSEYLGSSSTARQTDLVARFVEPSLVVQRELLALADHLERCSDLLDIVWHRQAARASADAQLSAPRGTQRTLDELLGAVKGLAVEPDALDPAKVRTEAHLEHADKATDVVLCAQRAKRRADLANAEQPEGRDERSVSIFGRSSRAREAHAQRPVILRVFVLLSDAKHVSAGDHRVSRLPSESRKTQATDCFPGLKAEILVHLLGCGDPFAPGPCAAHLPAQHALVASPGDDVLEHVDNLARQDVAREFGVDDEEEEEEYRVAEDVVGPGSGGVGA